MYICESKTMVFEAILMSTLKKSLNKINPIKTFIKINIS